MVTHFVTITIKVKVASDLTREEVIDELGSETDYTIGDTENVKVKETEIIEVD